MKQKLKKQNKNLNLVLNKRYENRPSPIGLRYGIIEVTTNCQLSCPGCYMVRRGVLNKGSMSLSQAIRILDLCRDYCGQELETMDILGGDPLLWPYLKDYINELLKRGILPWVFTNMLAINPALAQWFYERQVHITGKLNINPSDNSQYELQSKMIGRSAKIARLMIEKIKIFQEVGYKNPLFRLQNLIRRESVTHIPAYYRWCLENNIGTDLEMMGSGEIIDQKYWSIAATPQQIAVMINEVQKIRCDFGLEPAEVLMPHVFGACPFYDKGLYFAVDGNIRACSNSTIILSNIDNEEPITQAYESPLICNRLMLSQEVVGEPCRSCHKWDKCRGGCRATVEGMCDPFGGYPLCPLPYISITKN